MAHDTSNHNNDGKQIGREANQNEKSKEHGCHSVTLPNYRTIFSRMASNPTMFKSREKQQLLATV